MSWEVWRNSGGEPEEGTVPNKTFVIINHTMRDGIVITLCTCGNLLREDQWNSIFPHGSLQITYLKIVHKKCFIW